MYIKHLDDKSDSATRDPDVQFPYNRPLAVANPGLGDVVRHSGIQSDRLPAIMLGGAIDCVDEFLVEH